MASVGGETKSETKSEGLINELDDLLRMLGEGVEAAEELIGPPPPSPQNGAREADDSYAGRVNNRVEEARSRARLLLVQLGRMQQWF